MSSTYGLHLVSLIVRSYDEALDFFVGKLGFDLIEDSPAVTSVGNQPKRWVVVRPPNNPNGSSLLLAQASGPEQEAIIGKQWAGRVGLFWHVEDFDTAYSRLINAGAQFAEPPRDEKYGRVAVWVDIYGNKWDLIEPRKS